MVTTVRQESAARERILETATVLFYRDGYRAVGIDTIVAESGVAKMTLYRHFPSKDDLIAAYLERSEATFWDWFEGELRVVDDPKAKLIAALEAVATLATSERCLGCSFQAVAAEFPEPDHPGHHVALAHKRRVLERLGGLARQAGLRDPDGLAAQLLLLMDGAWVAARMFGPGNHADAVGEAARTLIEGHAAAHARPTDSNPVGDRRPVPRESRAATPIASGAEPANPGVDS